LGNKGPAPATLQRGATSFLGRMKQGVNQV
jgi:hypothetical protein